MIHHLKNYNEPSLTSRFPAASNAMPAGPWENPEAKTENWFGASRRQITLVFVSVANRVPPTACTCTFATADRVMTTRKAWIFSMAAG